MLQVSPNPVSGHRVLRSSLGDRMRVIVGILLLAGFSLAQSVTPFSLIEVSRQFDQTGTLKSEARFFFAMNRDGSIVSVDTFGEKLGQLSFVGLPLLVDRMVVSFHGGSSFQVLVTRFSLENQVEPPL